jgi:hypothetical protein
VVQIESQLGEIVRLVKPVAIHERVEEWLADLTVEMKSSLRSLLGKCVASSASGEPADPALYAHPVLSLAFLSAFFFCYTISYS